jgi:hypothetical protein
MGFTKFGSDTPIVPVSANPRSSQKENTNSQNNSNIESNKEGEALAIKD